MREAWVGYETRVGYEAWVGSWSLGYEAWGGLGRVVRERRVVKRVSPTERGCMLLVSRITVILLACWSVAARSAVSGHAPQDCARTHNTN